MATSSSGGRFLVQKILRISWGVSLSLVFGITGASADGLEARPFPLSLHHPGASLSLSYLVASPPNQERGFQKNLLFSRKSFSFWPADKEDEGPEAFRGWGLQAKLLAGWYYFSGGDVNRGARGLFDERVEKVSSRGYTTEYQKISPFRSGRGLALEVIYQLGTRLGIGASLGISHPHHTSKLKFYEVHSLPYLMWSDVDVKVLSLGLRFQYVVRAHRYFWLFFTGGPELHLVDYLFALNFTTPTSHEEISQKAEATGFGAAGSAGLELHLNPRVALVLEIHSRLAKIGNLKGKEVVYHLEESFPVTSEANGYLYATREGKYPGLTILSDEASQGKGIKRAVLDLSGIGFRTGLIFRF